MKKRVSIEIIYSSGDPLSSQVIKELDKQKIEHKDTDFRGIINDPDKKQNKEIDKEIRKHEIKRFPIVFINNSLMQYGTDNYLVIVRKIKEKLE